MGKNKNGYTLIELIITLAVLGIMIAPIFNAFNESIKVNVKAKSRIIATNIAQTSMERIKAMSSTEFKTEIYLKKNVLSVSDIIDINIDELDVILEKDKTLRYTSASDDYGDYEVRYIVKDITDMEVSSGVDKDTDVDITIKLNGDDDIKFESIPLRYKDIIVNISNGIATVYDANADDDAHNINFTSKSDKIHINIECTEVTESVEFSFSNSTGKDLYINIIDDIEEKLVVLPISDDDDKSGEIFITNIPLEFTSHITSKRLYKITIEVKKKDSTLIIVTNESKVGK